MTEQEEKRIRQLVIEQVRQEFSRLIDKNNEIVKKEISRRKKKYGRGQEDFIKSYLIGEKPTSDEMYNLTRQLFKDRELKFIYRNNSESNQFYSAMKKYWAIVFRLKELGFDFTVPYRVIVPSRSAFYRAFGGRPRVECNEINDLEGCYEDIF